MLLRVAGVLLLLTGVAVALGPARAEGATVPQWLPPLPHTVGMRGPDVDLIESGIAAFDRRDVRGARDDFRRALAIRSQTAIANFNLGVAKFQLGDREGGERSMKLGFRLANEHGMGTSPQAASMRAIARALNVSLD
jgi:hypothetical protein